MLSTNPISVFHSQSVTLFLALHLHPVNICRQYEDCNRKAAKISHLYDRGAFVVHLGCAIAICSSNRNLPRVAHLYIQSPALCKPHLLAGGRIERKRRFSAELKVDDPRAPPLLPFTLIIVPRAVLQHGGARSTQRLPPGAGRHKDALERDIPFAARRLRRGGAHCC